MTRAIFFDKDGVLAVDNGVSGTIGKIQLYPNAGEAISYCRENHFKTFLVTNQAIVARGIVDEQQLLAFLHTFRTKLIEQNPDAKLDEIYYCPHHPNANVEEYRIDCPCRKPKPGMLFRASHEYKINLKNSYIIGDRKSDIIAGKLAGVKTIQCLTGRHDEKPIETDLEYDEPAEPDYIIRDLNEIKTIVK